MSCPDELTLMVFVDGELSADRAEQVIEHRAVCAACNNLVTELETEVGVVVGVLSATVEMQPEASERAAWSRGLWFAVLVCAFAPAAFHALIVPFFDDLSWLRALGISGTLAGTAFSVVSSGPSLLLPAIGFAVTLSTVVFLLSLPSLHRRVLATLGASAATLAFLTLIAPSAVSAMEVRHEEGGTVRIAAGESIDDTVFLIGKRALVEGAIDGDLVVFAERIDIAGIVRGNVYGGGTEISIRGPISGNVHMAGGDLELESEIDGSALLIGKNVILADASTLQRTAYLAGESIRVKGSVGRDLFVAAEKAVVTGEIGNSVRGHVRQFAATSTAHVERDIELEVPDPESVNIDDRAVVSGETTITVADRKERHNLVRWEFYLWSLARLIGLFLFGFIVASLFPSSMPRVPRSSIDVLKKMGAGFVILIATPVAIAIIAITVIGLPVAVGLGVLYVGLLYVSKLVAAYVIAVRVSGQSTIRIVVLTAAGLLLILLAVELPVIGPGLNFLVYMLGGGILGVHLRDRYLASRASVETG